MAADGEGARPDEGPDADALVEAVADDLERVRALRYLRRAPRHRLLLLGSRPHHGDGGGGGEEASGGGSLRRRGGGEAAEEEEKGNWEFGRGGDGPSVRVDGD